MSPAEENTKKIAQIKMKQRERARWIKVARTRVQANFEKIKALRGEKGKEASSKGNKKRVENHRRQKTPERGTTTGEETRNKYIKK
jgi:hypothetical protein